MDAVECRLNGASFRMIVTNDWERNRAATLATKEPETVRWILRKFRDGDTLFDIGANNGVYTLLAAAHARGGRVVAVEPMAATFARLCENVVLNGFTNVEPHCLAIAASPGLGMLSLSSLDAASSMHSIGDAGLTRQFGESIVLRAGIGLTTIDALAATAGPPTLMKIDVDGGEDDVLAGAANTLRDPRLRSVIIEFNWTPTAPSRRDAPLLQAGFTPVEEGIEYKRADVRWRNVIYERG
jgi:FkbM family methyltransferase